MVFDERIPQTDRSQRLRDASILTPDRFILNREFLQTFFGKVESHSLILLALQNALSHSPDWGIVHDPQFRRSGLEVVRSWLYLLALSQISAFDWSDSIIPRVPLIFLSFLRPQVQQFLPKVLYLFFSVDVVFLHVIKVRATSETKVGKVPRLPLPLRTTGTNF